MFAVLLPLNFYVRGINQMHIRVHLLQVTIMFWWNRILQLISVIFTSQSALHNFTTEIRELLLKPGTSCATRACLGSRGKYRSPRSLEVEDTVLPFVSQIFIGAVAICFLIMGAALIRKWLDAPESKTPHIIYFLALRVFFWQNGGRCE